MVSNAPFSTASCLCPTHLYTGFLKEFHHLNQTPMLKGTCWGRTFQLRWPSNEAFSSKFAAAGGEGGKKVSGNEDLSNSNPKSSGTNPAIRYQLTSGLIAVNVLAYIADRGRYPILTLLFGSKDNYWIRKGQLWRLVTCSFLHASPLHLLVNCWSLLFIGTFMETISGPKRYLAVYFASAIAGSGLSYCLNTSRSVGASGAIFGLIGSYAVYVMRHREYLDERHKKAYDKATTLIALNAVLQVVGLLVKGTDNRLFVKHIDKWSNLGGFLGGAAASWLLGPAYKYASQTTAGGKRIFVDRPPISRFVKTVEKAESFE